MQQINILIARQKAQSFGRDVPSQFRIAEVTDMTALVGAMVNRKPTVLLLSLDFPSLDGPRGIRDLRKLNPVTKIIVLSVSTSEDEEREVLKMGARGYCGPSKTEVLLRMVEKVANGEVWAGRKTICALLDDFCGQGLGELPVRDGEQRFERLSEREREILKHIAAGESNKEIANALDVSVSTIKAHLTKIFRKLGQPDRVHLALCAAAARGEI